MDKKLEIRKTTREQRREETAAMIAAEEVKRNKDKNSYSHEINNAIREHLSPSDEIAILRHAIVILADALIQGGVLSKEDLSELLDWNELATKVKAVAKQHQKEGEGK